jgi:hypothetical protein
MFIPWIITAAWSSNIDKRRGGCLKMYGHVDMLLIFEMVERALFSCMKGYMGSFCFHCFTLGALIASNLRQICHLLLLGPDPDALFASIMQCG